MVIPKKIRSDRGTETVEAFAVHTTFHSFNDHGDPQNCWKYGRSVHNQKIECFWSHLVDQWLSHWREIFQELEYQELWEADDPIDKTALVYIYMPIIRQEITLYRKEYNLYPTRKNNLSRLPSGPPEDNYFLNNDVPDFAIAIDSTWLPIVRAERLNEYDVDRYLDATSMGVLKRAIEHSPFGHLVNIHNARDQYLFLRNYIRH